MAAISATTTTMAVACNNFPAPKRDSREPRGELN